MASPSSSFVLLDDTAVPSSPERKLRQPRGQPAGSLRTFPNHSVSRLEPSNPSSSPPKESRIIASYARNPPFEVPPPSPPRFRPVPPPEWLPEPIRVWSCSLIQGLLGGMAAPAGQAPSMEAFDAYFGRADLDKDGRISGAEAVAFFQGSNLPKQVLAQVLFYNWREIS